jgi:hypothetical protein
MKLKYEPNDNIMNRIKTLIKNKDEDRLISSIVLTENEYKQLYKYICNYEYEYIKSLLLHHDSIFIDGTQFKIEVEKSLEGNMEDVEVRY